MLYTLNIYSADVNKTEQKGIYMKILDIFRTDSIYYFSFCHYRRLKTTWVQQSNWYYI